MVPTKGNSGTAVLQGTNWTDSLSHWAKAHPVDKDVPSCPAAGRGQGVDTATDLRKNRVDTTNTYHVVPFDAVTKLPWQGLPRRRHLWSPAQAAQVAAYEGVPISVDGYLAEAVEQGKEDTNCGIDTHQWHDWHVWVVGKVSDATHQGRPRAIVVEVTPRSRPSHPGWSVALLDSLHRAHSQVRISGWLLLDPDHPDMVGQTRATIWEIHPVTRIAVREGNHWRSIP
jgi:hypothetical protein